MPFLVRIGRIDSNKSGVGSRGYAIRCVGKTVVLRWGQVDVIGGSIYWGGNGRVGGFWEKRIRRSSPAAARRYARWKKKILCTAETTRGGYHCLPAGARIYIIRPD